MATTVNKPNEIFLSTTRFPIKGRVSPALISTFPGRVTTGETSMADDLVASNWVISDQRGGILVEEMIEAVHQDRCWWSDCQIGFKGHIVLPPLVTQATIPTVMTITDGGLELWDDSSTLTNWTKSVGGGSLAREASVVRTGTYSAYMTASGSEAHFYQDAVTWSNDFRGKRFSAKIWARASDSSDLARIRIDDGVGETEATVILNPADTWTELIVSRVLDASATRLRIEVATTDGDDIYFDDFSLSVTGAINAFAKYNNDLYFTHGDYLSKINNADGTISLIGGFPTTITALTASEDNSLYIFLGDSYDYWYGDTSDSFTETDVANANFGVHWDSKLFKINTTGQIYDSTDPSAASPAWNTDGNLADEGLSANDIQGLFVYRDADGDPQIYAATKVGHYVHDFANDKWIATELTLPDHPTGGKGAIKWQEAAYLSAGLNVKKYIAARTATISDVGLDRDDGLPSDYRGEIVKLIEGYTEFFALVDSSLVTGTGYSGVYAYNTTGWQCKYISASADKVMTTGAVSSVFRYAFWFSEDSKLYWFPLKRDTQNPLQDAAFTYAAAGNHYTPWFDAAWVGSKNALSLILKCQGMSANEKITVSYRIDHSNTDISTGWTTLGSAIVVNGESELTFGTNAVGIEFKEIQFRFALVRGGTNTNTPDLQSANLRYEKLLDTKWGWTTTIDCSQQYGNNTPAQLVAALKTIISTSSTPTLVEFSFRDESGGTYTDYVRVANAQGLERSGEDWRSIFNVSLIAP